MFSRNKASRRCIINANVPKLEAGLNSFDYHERISSLHELASLVQREEVELPPQLGIVNLHCHTFFSYNAYGHSPASLAWLAKKSGFAAIGIVDFDGEVVVKANALELLRRELRSKRVKGYIGTGAMHDPYMPAERRLELTRRALALIAEQRFPVHVLTKSDLVLRDLDLLLAIDAAIAASTS